MADRPARRWLVDGNNVMGSRPDGWWRDRSAAKARLADQVANWASGAQRTVVLVFDGAPDARVHSMSGPELTVRFAGTGRANAADDDIVALANPGDIVVTADRVPADMVPAGVEVVGPSRFLAEIGSGSTRPTPA